VSELVNKQEIGTTAVLYIAVTNKLEGQM